MLRNIFLPLNLQFFADDQTDDSDNKDQDKGDQKDDKQIPYDRFKQVNDKAKLYESTLKDLGYEDLDTFKSSYAELLELKKKQELKDQEGMTEAEKLRADLDAKQKELQSLSDNQQTLLKQLEQEKIDRDFTKFANQHGIKDVEAAMKLANMEEVKVDGNKVTGVEEAVKALAAAKPYLVEKEQGSVGGGNNFDDRKGDKSKEELLKEAAEKARKTGRVEDLAQFQKLKRELGAK